MYTKWTSHLSNIKEKEQFEKEVFGSKAVLNRLKAIIDEQETELGRSETNPKTYDIPNWDYRQAHNNGYRQCLYVLKKLIDLDQQNSSVRTETKENIKP